MRTVPLLDPMIRGDAVLILDLLKGIRARAIDLMGRIDREPPVGWVPGESEQADVRAQT